MYTGRHIYCSFSNRFNPELKQERELQRFADEFNSMCEEVDQFDVIMERSA